MQCFICVAYLILFSNALPSSLLESSTIINEPEISTGVVEKGEYPNNLVSGQNTQEKKDDITSTSTSTSDLLTKLNENTKTVIGFNFLSMLTRPDITPNDDFSEKYKETIKDMVLNSKNSSISPLINEMKDMSQIGDTDRLTIINPTVIVNFRGTVLNREPDIKLKNRKRKPGAKQIDHNNLGTEKKQQD